MVELNIENLETWLKALRSGKFEQGRNRLYVSEPVGEVRGVAPGYCCLGVGCKVARVKFDPYMMLPPWKFWQWLGFTEADIVDRSQRGYINPNSLRLHVLTAEGQEMSVTTANDRLKWDFLAIADLIDENRDRLSLVA